MKKVYIAGPVRAKEYSETVRNMSALMEVSEKARVNGFAVYTPVLDILMGLKFGDYEFGDYFNNSVEWLKVADALLLTGAWDLSQGCLKELEIAESEGIPVFFTVDSIKDHFQWVEDTKIDEPKECKCEDCECEKSDSKYPDKIAIQMKGVLGLDEGDVLTYNSKSNLYEYSTEIENAEGFSEFRSAKISPNLVKKSANLFKSL